MCTECTVQLEGSVSRHDRKPLAGTQLLGASEVHCTGRGAPDGKRAAPGMASTDLHPTEACEQPEPQQLKLNLNLKLSQLCALARAPATYGPS
jgi:hypothetical protein